MEGKKVAIITGGARGIGEAAARIFLDNGYKVSILDIIEGREFTKHSHDENDFIFVKCDISKEAQVKNAVSKTFEEFGRIDVLLNIAGVVIVKPIEEITVDEFRRVVDVNIGGTFLMIKHVVPIMKKQRTGAIINMASVSGHVGQVRHSLYGATKGGIIAFTRALAWELSPFGIRVNSVSPGSVDTQMLRDDVSGEAKRLGRSYEQVKKEREAEQAFGRWAEPKEIAEAIFFLADERASFVTGTDLLVDCGWVAK
ncbi:MAG: SDR family oxidoreductase [Candidatus Thermoplasmatota archaeon]|jgi:NAD(P)-dependent dehydrogenase (short-subunit alcohol dehydrogenase family)|nr:SDR family oxidoreductase [Candidatus Thermoplasmatota archaeon]